MASNSKSPSTTDNGETNGTVVPSPRILRLIRMMEMEATAAAEESTFTGDDVMDIFEAESKADMYESDQRGPLNFQSLTGCEIELVDIEVKFSKGANTEGMVSVFRTPEGKGLYLMVKAVRTRKTGEEKKHIKLPEVGELFQANTSARFCVAKLMWLSTHGEVDSTQGRTERVKVQGTPLGDGQEVVKLLPVEPITVSA
jgi:hypothetical protein